MTVIDTLAAWCAQPHHFSDRARQLAHEAIADTLACLYAGRHDFSSRAVQQAWASQAAQPAAIVALLNGTAAHAIDYDDNFTPGMSHASAVLVPALLAVALEDDRDGEALVQAYLIGLQAQAWIGEVVSASHYTAGWHGTSTVGCIGTAAGVAWLKQHDRAGIARTLSIAVSLASGVKGQFGTPLKPFHAGMAARNAVEAAQLAATGMQGRFDIIEGAQGFSALYAGQTFSPTMLHHWLQPQPHVIEQVGVMPKKYPCCGSTHRVLDAIADLQAVHRFHDEQVAAVHCKVGIANLRNLAYPLPGDEMQARFSMPYCVATLLANGALSVSDFTAARVAMVSADKLTRITMESWSVVDEAEGVNLPHCVTITLTDGRRLYAERLSAVGALDDPFTEAERLKKFMDCCGELRDAQAIWQRLAVLEQQPQLRFLRKMLV